MIKEERREIKQLLIVARNYFHLGEKLKKEVPPEVLNKKIIDYSDQEKIDEKNIMPSAHLASSAIRLCTIDEKLDDKYRNTKEERNIFLRRKLYNRIRFSFKRKNMITNIRTEDIDKVLHFILRNNIVHIEEDKRKYQQKGHLILQNRLLSYSTNDMYTKIGSIMTNIEKDLKSLNIIQ